MINFFYHWRGGQAVRQESAKLLYAGAIPAHASMILCLGDETGKHTALKMLRATPLWVRVPPEAHKLKTEN